MEILTTVVSLILLLGLILFPIILFIGIERWNKLKFEFLTYLTIGLIIAAGIVGTSAWWADFSDQLLMRYYGYDFNAMNEIERFSRVADENKERVKQLEISYFGIGWPLKAAIGFVSYSPYLLIVYLVGLLVERTRGEKGYPQ